MGILSIKRDDSLQRCRGEAGMEAIRKILDSQAVQLILVSPRGGGGWGGGVQSAWTCLTERTPSPLTHTYTHCKSQEKGTRVGLFLAVEK